jgi:transposase-like protein
LAEAPEITQLPAPGTSERIAVMRDIKAGTVRYRRPLSDEQEVEVLDAYTRTDDSIEGIARKFGVRSTYLYNVLDRAGVSWRRNDGITFDEWQARQQRPQAVETPKEPEVIVPEETRTLPPQIEAMRAIRPRSPSPAPEPLQFEGEVWEVTFTGKMLVQATSARDAIEAAERDGHVTNIVGVNFRGRA